MNKNTKILISSLQVGVCIYAYLYFSDKGILPFHSENVKNLVFILVLSNIMGVGIGKLNAYLDAKISWHESPGVRFLLGLLFGNLILFAVPFAVYSYFPLKPWVGEDYFLGLGVNQDLIVKWLLLNFIVLLIFTITDLMLFSYNHFVKGQIESVKLSRKQYELQFEALKTRLSPHYLFNSFNTISSLIYLDKTKAEDFIRKLVQTYQYILKTKDQHLVTLKEELAFVRSYQYLLKVRYEGALKMRIDLPDDLMNSMLPPLTLQILVENAVKHNIISESEPLDINIHLNSKGLLTVSNSKNEKKIKEKSFYIGIENIKNRYRYFTEQSIQILNTKNFEVGLPILAMKQ